MDGQSQMQGVVLSDEPPLDEVVTSAAIAPTEDAGRSHQTGLKALVTVAARMGRDWSLPRLLHIHGGQGEPDLAKLAGIATIEGLQAKGQTLAWTDLSALAKVTPFLARLTNGCYVVIAHTPATFVRKTGA